MDISKIKLMAMHLVADADAATETVDIVTENEFIEEITNHITPPGCVCHGNNDFTAGRLFEACNGYSLAQGIVMEVLAASKEWSDRS